MTLHQIINPQSLLFQTMVINVLSGRGAPELSTHTKWALEKEFVRMVGDKVKVPVDFVSIKSEKGEVLQIPKNTLESNGFFPTLIECERQVVSAIKSRVQIAKETAINGDTFLSTYNVQ